jgi:hypothetical protein
VKEVECENMLFPSSLVFFLFPPPVRSHHFLGNMFNLFYRKPFEPHNNERLKKPTKKKNIKKNVQFILPKLFWLARHRLRRFFCHLFEFHLQAKNPSHFVPEDHLQEPIVSHSPIDAKLCDHFGFDFWLSPSPALIFHPNTIQKIEKLKTIKITCVWVCLVGWKRRKKVIN